MREILFRARTISEDEYMDSGEWVEGFYTCFNGDEYRIYTGYSETDCGDHYPDWFNVLPETVGQYTGLTDKNGKRIFEGDILKNEYEKNKYQYFKVFYCSRTYCWLVENKYGMLGKLYNVIGDIEIIGNIHDNPELLK